MKISNFILPKILRKPQKLGQNFLLILSVHANSADFNCMELTFDDPSYRYTHKLCRKPDRELHKRKILSKNRLNLPQLELLTA